MARHIKTDGTVTKVAPKDGIEFTLEEMKNFVGGLHRSLEAHKHRSYVPE